MKEITKDQDLWVKIHVEELEPRQEFAILPGAHINDCSVSPVFSVCFHLCYTDANICVGNGGGGGCITLNVWIC